MSDEDCKKQALLLTRFVCQTTPRIILEEALNNSTTSITIASALQDHRASLIKEYVDHLKAEIDCSIASLDDDATAVDEITGDDYASVMLQSLPKVQALDYLGEETLETRFDLVYNEMIPFAGPYQLFASARSDDWTEVSDRYLLKLLQEGLYVSKGLDWATDLLRNMLNEFNLAQHYNRRHLDLCRAWLRSKLDTIE